VAEVEMLLEAYQTHLDTTYNKLRVRGAEASVGRRKGACGV
jgi:hypothetical protein